MDPNPKASDTATAAVMSGAVSRSNIVLSELLTKIKGTRMY